LIRRSKLSKSHFLKKVVPRSQQRSKVTSHPKIPTKIHTMLSALVWLPTEILMLTLIYLYTICTFLMAPAFYYYTSGSGYGGSFGSYDAYSMGNFGYSEM